MIRGPKWKYIRNLLSSLMTTVSLKKAFSHFNNAATTYADKFSKAAGDSETVDLVRLAKFKTYTFFFKINE